MNMATRALARDAFTWERVQNRSWPISFKMFAILFLAFAVLASALSVIYIKTLQRNLYNELQASQQEREQLKTKWSQLLLEENTWAAPVRIQSLAQQELGMQVPQQRITLLTTKP
jgi:cell division protein FtsL